MGGKMRNIAIQLGLQQCCKTSCTYFVARFTAALVLFCIVSSGVQTSVFIQNYADFGPLFLSIHFVRVWSFFVTEH